MFPTGEGGEVQGESSQAGNIRHPGIAFDDEYDENPHASN